MQNKKNIQLQIKDQSNKLLVKADENKLELVISNLLSNAIKFTDSGKISIETKCDKDKLIVSVIDTGIGIDHIDLPYVFDRFYRGKNNKNSKGSGIGLTIAKTWIEAHGGEIFADSEGVGKGATFWFTLPI
ncbi:MAG: sensor histidine kinase [Elusimicrobiota bacterium]